MENQLIYDGHYLNEWTADDDLNLLELVRRIPPEEYLKPKKEE